MNIGILGGTFDPPTLAHLWVVQQILEDEKAADNGPVKERLDKVWMMPNTGSGCYGKKTKTPAGYRLEMCRLAVKDFFQGTYVLPEEIGWPFGLGMRSPVEVSDIEIANGFDYTYQLAEHLERTQPNEKFHFIMGGDWDISKFKEWERIARVFEFIQIHRPRKGGKPPYIDAPQEIQFRMSSSAVRERASQGKTIRGLVTPSVERFIQINDLYKE